MIEKTPLANIVTYAILLLALTLVLVPFWIVICASTQSVGAGQRRALPLRAGRRHAGELRRRLEKGRSRSRPVQQLRHGGLVTAGKIAVSALSAFAIALFRSRWASSSSGWSS